MTERIFFDEYVKFIQGMKVVNESVVDGQA